MIRCLIVDDEHLAREAIKAYIEKIPELALVGECENALQAMAFLRKENIDLIFLDIEMPEIDGISFLKYVKNNPRVVFTTAYRNYAIEAFDLDVIDYLLKPISFERFVLAINKFYERKNSNVSHNETNKTNRNFINIKANRKTYKIDIVNIDYIESLKDYVKIICADESIITHDSLSNFETILKEYGFIRTHNSFLVAIDKIKSFNSESVFLKNKELPISRTYKKFVLSHLER
ncbi:response regulator [Maribellus comscasis]|uniref:Response regulator n=1 Tax=Maribellus comscasis TaxID=2681766 RepID=A0A6I6JP10_9BACT|nr:LytTR family DNA-binding domain-containing protein [Maribellus comscasis]QGY44706.1 response regulator [Maribellus comscasis]